MSQKSLSPMQKAGIVFFAVGVAICIVGLVAPPWGHIPSEDIECFGLILAGIGILMAWDTVKYAIDKRTPASVKIKDMEIGVNNPDNQNDK